MSATNKPEKLFIDPSLWSLLLSNFVVIFLQEKGNWTLSTILWIYWFQSITIGFFHFIKILQLKAFSTEGLTINGRTPLPTQETKRTTAFFFLFHYGGFHFVYLIFLLDKYNLNFIELKYILPTALLFFINHLFSYIFNKSKDTKEQNIGSFMLYPYARIIPMHLTILFGSFFIDALPFFLGLKTIADGTMHVVGHKVHKPMNIEIQIG